MTTSRPARSGDRRTPPTADTMLTRFLFNWDDSVEALARSLGGAELQRKHERAADVGRPADFANTVTLMRPVESGEVAQLLALLDGFYRFGSMATTGPVYLVSAWTTPDLRPHGWRVVEHLPLCLLPAGRRPPATDFAITSVRHAEDLRLFEETAVAAYPIPELAGRGPGAIIGKSALQEDRMRLWIGRVGGVPAGIAGTFVAHGINGVIYLATKPEARRHGLGAGLAWTAALAEPGLPAMLLASEPGRSVYESMGFLPICRFTLWCRHRGDIG